MNKCLSCMVLVLFSLLANAQSRTSATFQFTTYNFVAVTESCPGCIPVSGGTLEPVSNTGTVWVYFDTYGPFAHEFNYDDFTNHDQNLDADNDYVDDLALN